MLTTTHPRPRRTALSCPAPIAARLPHLLVVALLVLAAGVRLRNILDYPPFTDETDEVLRALAIARGQLWPLVNDDAYIGALFNYLVAGLFLLFGPSPLTPRLLVLGTGVATVGLTAWLAREAAGRWAGPIAAALLASSGLHIIVNSRVAWSHATTPLFTTGALVALLIALRRGSGPLLVLAGLLAGLAVQTHPSAIALLPGLVAGYLLHPRGRRWLRSGWPYLAAAVAVLSCANLLWFNLVTNPMQAWREAVAYDYAFAPKAGAGPLLASLPQYAVDLVRAHGSVYGTRTNLVAYLSNPAFITTTGLLLAGLLWALWRRQWLLAITFISGALIMTVFGRQFGFLPNDTARYFSPLLPIGYTLIAGAVTAAAAGLRRAARQLPGPIRPAASAAAVGAAVLGVAALAWFPLQATIFFEDTHPRRVENDLITRAIAVAEAAGSPVLVDARLNSELLFGGGHLQFALIYLLDLHGTPRRDLAVPSHYTGADLAAALPPGTIIILHDDNRRRLRPLPLEPLFVVTPKERSARDGYGVYRVGSH